jgi:hypothetical protein
MRRIQQEESEFTTTERVGSKFFVPPPNYGTSSFISSKSQTIRWKIYLSLRLVPLPALLHLRS